MQINQLSDKYFLLQQEADKLLDSNHISPHSNTNRETADQMPGFKKHDMEIPKNVIVSPGVTYFNLSAEGMQLLTKMSREEQDTFLEFQKRLQDSNRNSTEASMVLDNLEKEEDCMTRSQFNRAAKMDSNSLNKSSSYILAGIGNTDESIEAILPQNQSRQTTDVQ